MLKIEHRNQFSTLIKGNNSVLIWRNLPIYNPKPLLPNINSNTNFELISSKNAENRARKLIFNINQGQLLLAYLTKLTHRQSQTTPPQYQLLYKVWWNRPKNTQDREQKQNGGQMDRRIYLQDGHSEVLNGNLPLQIYVVDPSPDWHRNGHSKQIFERRV